MDNNKSLNTCQINEVAQVITTLSSIRNNNSTPEQILTASAIIKKEYPNLKLGELQEVIINGILQKYNNSEQPQYNDIPSLMFWLKKNKPQKEYF